jgi:hypothetical protein
VELFVNVTLSGGTHAKVGVAEKEGVGGGRMTMLCMTVLPEQPLVSVAVNFTGYIPWLVYACEVVLVVTLAVFPSPKSQPHVPIGAPPGEITVASLNSMFWPTQAVSVLIVNPVAGLL